MIDTVKRDDGVCVIQNGGADGYRFTLFIPSRKRQKRVVDHPLFEVANIIVHEDEYDAYAAEFERLDVEPGSLITHDVQGLGRIHNRMLDFRREDEDWQHHTDDDFAGMLYLQTFRPAKAKACEPQKIIDVWTHTYIAASDATAGVFVFAQSAIPNERHAYTPFSLRGWGMTACMGIIDHELRFDDNLPISVDIDFCLQAIAKRKYLWQDRRWWGWCNEKNTRTGADPGVLAGIRSQGIVDEVHRYLAKKWGDDVVLIGAGKTRGLGLSLRIKVPKRG